jgi:hypothetical protein
MDIITLILFLTLYTAGRVITKADNQMLLVYRNHIQYQRYYAPGSGLHAKTPIIKASVPMYVGKRGLS